MILFSDHIGYKNFPRIRIMAIVVSVILLFVGIGVLIVIHVCIVGRAFRRGLANNSVAERGSFGSASMSQDDIEKLPSFSFRDEEKGSSSPVDCAVCLENLKAGEKCRLLPLCKHSFHAECVDVWLLKAAICPICRTGADKTASGVINLDEEMGFFNEEGTENRESVHSSEAALESAESVHPMNPMEVRVIPTSMDSSHVNDSRVGENEAEEEGDHQNQTLFELTESQAEGSSHSNDGLRGRAQVAS